MHYEGEKIGQNREGIWTATKIFQLSTFIKKHVANVRDQ